MATEVITLTTKGLTIALGSNSYMIELSQAALATVGAALGGATIARGMSYLYGQIRDSIGDPAERSRFSDTFSEILADYTGPGVFPTESSLRSGIPGWSAAGPPPKVETGGGGPPDSNPLPDGGGGRDSDGTVGSGSEPHKPPNFKNNDDVEDEEEGEQIGTGEILMRKGAANTDYEKFNEQGVGLGRDLEDTPINYRIIWNGNDMELAQLATLQAMFTKSAIDIGVGIQRVEGNMLQLSAIEYRDAKTQKVKLFIEKLKMITSAIHTCLIQLQNGLEQHENIATQKGAGLVEIFNNIKTNIVTITNSITEVMFRSEPLIDEEVSTQSEQISFANYLNSSMLYCINVYSNLSAESFYKDKGMFNIEQRKSKADALYLEYLAGKAELFDYAFEVLKNVNRVFAYILKYGLKKESLGYLDKDFIKIYSSHLVAFETFPRILDLYGTLNGIGASFSSPDIEKFDFLDLESEMFRLVELVSELQNVENEPLNSTNYDALEKSFLDNADLVLSSKKRNHDNLERLKELKTLREKGRVTEGERLEGVAAMKSRVDFAKKALAQKTAHGPAAITNFFNLLTEMSRAVQKTEPNAARLKLFKDIQRVISQMQERMQEVTEDYLQGNSDGVLVEGLSQARVIQNKIPPPDAKLLLMTRIASVKTAHVLITRETVKVLQQLNSRTNGLKFTSAKISARIAKNILTIAAIEEALTTYDEEQEKKKDRYISELRRDGTIDEALGVSDVMLAYEKMTGRPHVQKPGGEEAKLKEFETVIAEGRKVLEDRRDELMELNDKLRNEVNLLDKLIVDTQLEAETFSKMVDLKAKKSDRFNVTKSEIDRYLSTVRRQVEVQVTSAMHALVGESAISRDLDDMCSNMVKIWFYATDLDVLGNLIGKVSVDLEERLKSLTETLTTGPTILQQMFDQNFQDMDQVMLGLKKITVDRYASSDFMTLKLNTLQQSLIKGELVAVTSFMSFLEDGTMMEPDEGLVTIFLKKKDEMLLIFEEFSKQMVVYADHAPRMIAILRDAYRPPTKEKILNKTFSNLTRNLKSSMRPTLVGGQFALMTGDEVGISIPEYFQKATERVRKNYFLLQKTTDGYFKKANLAIGNARNTLSAFASELTKDIDASSDNDLATLTKSRMIVYAGYAGSFLDKIDKFMNNLIVLNMLKGIMPLQNKTLETVFYYKELYINTHKELLSASFERIMNWIAQNKLGVLSELSYLFQNTLVQQALNYIELKNATIEETLSLDRGRSGCLIVPVALKGEGTCDTAGDEYYIDVQDFLDNNPTLPSLVSDISVSNASLSGIHIKKKMKTGCDHIIKVV